MMFTVLAFAFMCVGLTIGLLRSHLIGGKGIAILSFAVSGFFFLMLSYSSLAIDLTSCDGSGCSSEIVQYDYLVWVNVFFGLVNVILIIVYSILQFGELFNMKYYGKVT